MTKHTLDKIKKAVTVGTSYLGADLAQRESDDAPCDVDDLGMAIDLLEAVPHLIASLDDMALWSVSCIKVMEMDGNKTLATGLEMRRRAALAILAKATLPPPPNR